MATPDYSKIWGANSPLAKYEFTEADYLRGWEFIGSMPPARTMFDAWMRKADEKMRWLYDNAFSENSLGGFLFWRLPDTAYFVGEKRALQDGPLDVYIECTIAGRTSKEQMKKLPQGAEIGKTFVDGTATWLVRQFTTSAALDDHRKKTPLDHPDGSVTTAKLADGSVTTAKLADKSVTAKQLAVSAGELGAYTKAETDARLNTKAALASPALTGTPTAPTAGRGTNNAQVATTAFVTQAIAALINGSPGALDTLQELAKALGNDADFAATVTNALAGKVAKSGDTMTGRLTAPSVLVNDWFRALGNCGFYFENHGGGWHMTDDEWIRAHNGKGIYTSGKIRCDAGFEGDLRGTAGNANTVGDKSLQWILEQISAAKTGIVNGNLEQNGWVKFANGLIIQWLYNATPSANGIAFPITFSYKCFAVFSNRTNNTHSGDVCSTHVHSFTNSWVKVWSGKTDEAMNFGSYYKVNILAVGI